MPGCAAQRWRTRPRSGPGLPDTSDASTLLLVRTAPCGSPRAVVLPRAARQPPSPRIRWSRKRSCRPHRRGVPVAPVLLGGRCARRRRASRRMVPRQRDPQRQPGIAVCDVAQFLLVDHILPRPGRVQEDGRHGTVRQSPVPQHAHERHNPAAAADQQEWVPRLGGGPHEMTADGPAQFDRVACLQLIGEEWRDLAVFQALHGELQPRRLGRRGD